MSSSHGRSTEHPPVKIFYVGTFLQEHVSDPYRSKGFRQAGCEVIEYDYRSREKAIGKSRMWEELLRLIGTEHPQILLINKGESISPEILRTAKMQFPRMMAAIFYGDQRGYCIRELALLASVSDLLLINNADPVQFQGYRNLGVPDVMTWHTASDPDVYRPMSGKGYECDVAFMGGCYSCFPDSGLREELIRVVSSSFRTNVYGTGWPTSVRPKPKVYGEDFARAVAGAKVVLGINAYNDVYQYTSNRTWNCLSCGSAVYMSYYFAGMEDLFVDGTHLIVFHSVDEAVQRIRDIITDRGTPVCQQIAKAGRQLILDKHSYRARAEELLERWRTWNTTNEKRLRKGIGPYEDREGSKNIV